MEEVAQRGEVLLAGDAGFLAERSQVLADVTQRNSDELRPRCSYQAMPSVLIPDRHVEEFFGGEDGRLSGAVDDVRQLADVGDKLAALPNRDESPDSPALRPDPSPLPPGFQPQLSPSRWCIITSFLMHQIRNREPKLRWARKQNGMSGHSSTLAKRIFATATFILAILLTQSQLSP